MYNIKTLNPRHYKIIELCLRGCTPGQIASELNMTRQAVTVITNSQSFQHEYAMEKEKVDSIKHNQIATESVNVRLKTPVSLTVKEKIKAATLSAVDKLVENINSSDETIAMRAATEVLDRGGHPKSVKNENVESVEITISDEAITRITEALEKDIITKPL